MGVKGFCSKFNEFFKDGDLKLELRTATVKLIIVNYLILLIQLANEKLEWAFPGTGAAERYGYNNTPAASLYLVRDVTLLLNSAALVVVYFPRLSLSQYLLSCLLWNAYTIVAFGDNCVVILMALFEVEGFSGIIREVFVVSGFIGTLLLKQFTLVKCQYLNRFK